jgi:hypothetical protein
LNKAEVKTVLTALLQARAKTEAFDTHQADGKAGKDQKISTQEAAAAADSAGSGLASDLALAALQGAENDASTSGTLKSQLGNQFARAEAALTATKGRDGSVSMKTLETAFARLPNGVDGDALLSAISNAFERARTVSSGGGCGGGSTTTVYDAPTKLTKSEVASVREAFADAMALVDDAGTLNAKGMKALIAAAEAKGDLVGAFMDALVTPHIPAAPPAPSYGSGGC